MDETRLLVLGEERVANPDFYPMLRNLGFDNLPDQSGMGAIIFFDTVVSHEPFSDGLLFHEFVHIEQYSAAVLGGAGSRRVDSSWKILAS